jgi:hypothetical protein
MSAAQEIPSELILAAIDRARVHRAAGEPTVPVWVIFEHLGIPRRSAAARQVRQRLDVLEADGRVQLHRVRGIQAWEITPAGQRDLQRLRRTGNVPELPESPQHARWRNARTLAGQEIERFHTALRDAVEAATGMLDAPVTAGPSSDEWFEIAERLRREGWRVGSATYCLREWAEPDDAHPDIDDGGHEPVLSLSERSLRSKRAGRRNTHNWDRRA